tara:strand:- start:240 stop:425 length:186 start_codon:yes stop_codon:yes gene_type:complete
MQIAMKSMLTGNITTREIPVTDEQLAQWSQGALIQDVMPDVSADDREFIKTGITPEEWGEL